MPYATARPTIFLQAAHETPRYNGKHVGKMGRKELQGLCRELGIADIEHAPKTELLELVCERLEEIGKARSSYGAFPTSSPGRDQEIPRAFTAAGDLRGKRPDSAPSANPRAFGISRPDAGKRG